MNFFADDLKCIYESEFGIDASLLIKATDTTLGFAGYL